VEAVIISMMDIASRSAWPVGHDAFGSWSGRLAQPGGGSGVASQGNACGVKSIAARPRAGGSFPPFRNMGDLLG